MNYLDAVHHYRQVHYVDIHGIGYVVWRRGTGDNVELLHIRATVSRVGHGRRLFHEMMDRLANVGERPYHSVFGFTRVSNVRAKEFYAAMGFDLTPVPHVYADGSGVMFSQSYETLVRVMNERRKM